PDLIEAQVYQAYGYLYFDHDPARALAAVEPLFSRAPNDPLLWRVVANAKAALGDFQGQVNAMKHAVELDPRNTELLNKVGSEYCSLRRYREGIETFSRACALEPEAWASRMNLAQAFMASDRLAEAREELQQLPDPKLESLMLVTKYDLLQLLEIWNRNYDGALALAAKIPDM